MSRNAFQKIRVVGIEDGSFKKGVNRETLLAAVLFKGFEIERVNFRRIIVDGLDATDKAVSMLDPWNFEAIMLAGVSFAGFNVIDPMVLYEKFQKPIIVVSRTKPNNKKVKRALVQHFRDWKRRWEIFAKIGPIYKVKVLAGEPPIYIEVVGAEAEWAVCLMKSLAVCSRVPEPLRVARLIARGLS
jgi:endonuclease V-like protein UPF0215 family